MVVAALMVHAHIGFFMNWMGKQAGEGFEYHLIALGLAIVIMVQGAGALSLDRLITVKSKRS
jgi:putative oxidoreductase